MVGEKIQLVDSTLIHIFTNKVEQRPRHPLAAAVLFDVYSANIRYKVAPLVKVIFNNSKSAEDFIAYSGNIPLRVWGFFAIASVML